METFRKENFGVVVTIEKETEGIRITLVERCCECGNRKHLDIWLDGDDTIDLIVKLNTLWKAEVK